MPDCRHCDPYTAKCSKCTCQLCLLTFPSQSVQCQACTLIELIWLGVWSLIMPAVLTCWTCAKVQWRGTNAGRLRLWRLLTGSWASLKWSSPFGWGLRLWTCTGWCEWAHGWTKHCTPLWSLGRRCEGNWCWCRPYTWAEPLGNTKAISYNMF